MTSRLYKIRIIYIKLLILIFQLIFQVNNIILKYITMIVIKFLNKNYEK